MNTTTDLRFHTLRKRHNLWLIPLIFGAWFALSKCGLDVDVAYLLSVSGYAIVVTAISYREAYRHVGYWVTIASYFLVHWLFFTLVGGSWIPTPAMVLTPFFILDYIVMAFLLPKFIGVKFSWSASRP
ncbi:hypothetical protein [Brevundimonas sp.]|uniref:hypothetical protein n=1 Tax=Brevundimonas sp. TaxID=1871086 RepID=UPI001D1D0B5C|nr:hypothetical protein [Brevundimonas sp.]MBL0948929.1 hypothetical protein [Brevundimonas sp.]